MGFDLYSLDYLKVGSARQRRAYDSLAELSPLSRLDVEHEGGFGLQPALVGSLPLDLALEDSDLIIATFSADLKSYSQFLRAEFGSPEGFESTRGIQLGVATLVTRFRFKGELYEIFTQNVPVPRQNSVVHLMVEERLLLLGGESFREKIWAARRSGMKTEPAFGAVLGLEEPYRELLELEDLDDDDLRGRFSL
ncbi:DUF4269 domain-containing protein [soil metagenome]